MKPPSFSVFIRVAVVIIAGALAYIAGVAQHQAALLAPLGQKQSNLRPGGAATVNAGMAAAPHSNNQAVISGMRAMKINGLMFTNRAQALAQLANLPLGGDTPHTYAMAFQFSREEAPAMALDLANTAFGLPPGANRDFALKSVVNCWGQDDPKAMLEWASGLADADSGPLKYALNNVASMQQEPALAAQYVGELTDATARADIVGTIAWAMAKTDPAGTLDWLDSTATGDAYDTSVTNLMSNLITQNPAQAAALVGNISEPDVQAAAITNVANAWGATDPAAALAWVNSLPDSEANARSAALNSTIAGWAKADPTAAMAYVQNSPDPSTYLGAAPTIAGSLAQSDPSAALAWTNSLPAGPAKNQALSNVLDNLAGTDFNTAWNDAANLPAGDGRDLAMANLIGVQAQTNPTQAAALVGQFPAGSAQTNATEKLAATWAVQNPKAFIQWASALPPGGQQDAALAAALKAAQSAKLPPAQRAALVQKLTPAPSATK